MGKRGQRNGEKQRLMPGHSDRHFFGHLENKREKRERLMREADKKIAELQHRVAVSQQAAQAAINLLKPYSVERKASMPLRRAFERTGKT
jgi:hypothetical protein